METLRQKIDRIFNLNRVTRTEQDNQSKDVLIWLRTGVALRKAIGFMGMGLPLLLWAWLLIAWGRGRPLDSISSYYHTHASGAFVITLGTMAIFLIMYQGRSRLDHWVSGVAGVAALGVVFFPCAPLGPDDVDFSVVNYGAAPWREKVHLGSA